MALISLRQLLDHAAENAYVMSTTWNRFTRSCGLRMRLIHP